LKIENLDSVSVFFILFCLVAPWSVAAMQIILFLIVLFSISKAIKNKKSPIAWHTFYVFPIIYIISLTISVLLSADISVSIKSAINNDWYLLILPFIASANISDKARKQAFIILIVSATIAGIYGIVQFFDGVEYIHNKALYPRGDFYRAIGAYGFYLTFAGNQLLVFAIAISFLLFHEKWNKYRYLLLISLIILFLSVIVTFGRSAWLGVFLIIFLGIMIVNRKLLFVALGLLGIAFISIFLFFPLLMDRFSSIFDLSQNTARLTIWKTSWNIAVHHPFFGIGPGFFSDYFQIYKVPGFYDRMGHAHNDYLNTAVYGGFIGLLTWLGMWLGWFYYAIKAYLNTSTVKLSKTILLSGILALAGILFASGFQCYYTDLENNLLWWFVLSVGVMIFVNQK
jgi:O-antigen ligase